MSVGMQQLENHWTDFDNICNWRVFLKFVDTIQFHLMSDKNNGHLKTRGFLRTEVTLKLHGGVFSRASIQPRVGVPRDVVKTQIDSSHTANAKVISSTQVWRHWCNSQRTKAKVWQNKQPPLTTYGTYESMHELKVWRQQQGNALELLRYAFIP
jgi:hypothetical protein